jgi:hypothetical protein
MPSCLHRSSLTLVAVLAVAACKDAAPAPAAAPAAPGEPATITAIADQPGGKAAAGKRVTVSGKVLEVAERDYGGRAFHAVQLRDPAAPAQAYDRPYNVYCMAARAPGVAEGAMVTATGTVAVDELYGTVLAGCQVAAAR